MLANGRVNGGSGVWTAGPTNWTNVTGSTAKTWGGQLAVFAGAAGTVVVQGDMAFTGLQFDVDGYVLLPGAGGVLTTSTAETSVSVAPATTTMIGAPIAGSGGLVVDGGGTLMLAGANSYTGGTTVRNAVLAIGHDQHLGAPEGTLTVDGGTLRTTAPMLSARAITLGPLNGTIETVADTMFFADGVLAGAGALTKAGEGLLRLSGTNTYAGGTTIAAGTLAVSANENLGDAAGSVTFTGGTLLTLMDMTSNRGVTLAGAGTIDANGGTTFLLGGEIAGPGGLTKSGGGTLVLTAENTFTGGTTIEAGTLQLGDCGTSGSIVGDIVNDSLLIFSRSDTSTYSGVISGSGAVFKECTGTQVLRGANTYTGGTLVSAGTLVGDTTSLQGTIVNDSVLVFDQDDDGTFSGVIGGTGTLEKTGSGTVLLTGDHPLEGATTIRAGTLALDGQLLGAVNVMAGATFDAVGAIGGGLLVDGTVTVRPTSDGAFGVLGVMDHVTFNPESHYGVSLDAAGSNSILATLKTATIDGAIVDVNLAPGDYGRATHYAILQANSGLTGAATAVASGSFDPILTQNNTTLFLTLLRTDLPLQAVAATANGWSIGAALDRIKADASGDLHDVTSELTALDDATLGLALGAIAGEIHASATQLAAIDGEAVMDAVRSEVGIRAWSRRPEGAPRMASESAWGFGHRRGWVRLRSEQGTFDPEAAIGGRAGAHGGDLDLQGVTAGVDWTLGRHWLVGIAGSFASGQIGLDGLQERSDYLAPRAVGYVGYRVSRLMVDGGVSVARTWYDRTRAFSFVAMGPTGEPLFGGVDRLATSNPTGAAAEAWASTRVDIPVGSWDLQPSVGVRAARFGLDSWTERGAEALSLTGASQANRSTQADAGLRFARALGRFRPYIGAMYRRELGNRRTTATLRLGEETDGMFEVSGLSFAEETAAAQAGFMVLRD